MPVSLIGYCMGGLLALALAQLMPVAISKLVLIATPWDFHCGYGGNGLSLPPDVLSDVMAQVDKHQFMSVDLIQSLFAAQQPFKVVQKFMDFSRVDPDSRTARRFVVVEDWLNDGVPLSAPVAHECLEGWFVHNDTAGGRWHVGDVLIDPRAVHMPTYIVVAQKDRLVPPESALPLSQLLPNVRLEQPDLGHVGLMASTKACDLVWRPLAGWLSV